MKKTVEQNSRNLIGRKIKQLRLSQRTKVSQEDLAGRLAAQGVVMDRSAIARIEQGTRYVMDYEAMAFAKVFRVKIGVLFSEEIEE